MACTTLLVGKGATYDGSTMIARTEDDGDGTFSPKKLVVVTPEDQPRTYRSVLSHLEMELPDDPVRYTSMPNVDPAEGVWGEAGVNAHDVAMSATETITTNARVLGADPLVKLRPAEGDEPERPGGLGEEDLLTVVLPYVRTAREGVERLGALLEAHGTYESNGVAFSDANEVWYLESVGGHHWIARRVPDDCYVAQPNQLGIDRLDLGDALDEGRDNLCSADLVDFIVDNHLYLGGDEGADERFRGLPAVIDPRPVFGSLTDTDRIYNTPRAWYMQRMLDPHDGPDEAGHPRSGDLPWCRVPEAKVTVEAVLAVLSSHYQDTPYDTYGSGPEAGSFRPIGINRNNECSLIQVRADAPAGCAAVQWVAMGDMNFATFVPVFTNVDSVPAYLSDTTMTVDTSVLYWQSRLVAALADGHYRSFLNALEAYKERTLASGHGQVAAADRDAASASDGDDVRTRLEQANERSCELVRKATDALLFKALHMAAVDQRDRFSLNDA